MRISGRFFANSYSFGINEWSNFDKFCKFDVMNASKQKILQLIKLRVQEIDPLAEVILYGSKARGDDHSGSDWDILILTNYPPSIEKERKFRHHLFDLELEIEEVFSTFVYYKKDWNVKMRITPFYRNVLKEGIRL